MPTIKLSKLQWEFIGKKAGWIKKAQMEVVNALLQKGWAKKLPDGSIQRTYWPKDVFEKEVLTNQELKQLWASQEIVKDSMGNYKLLPTIKRKEPTTPTVLDTDKPMPKLSSKK